MATLKLTMTDNYVQGQIKDAGANTVKHLIRMGGSQTADNIATQAVSSISLLTTSVNNDFYGVDFRNYNAATNTASINYMSKSSANSNNLDMITIRNIHTANATASAKFDSATINNVSSGTVSAGEASVLSTLRVFGTAGNAITALNAYEGVRFKNSADTKEFGMFMKSDAGLLAYVDSGAVKELVGYKNSKSYGYATTLSSVTGDLTVESRILADTAQISTISSYAISTNLLFAQDAKFVQYTSYSDERLKKNVAPLEHALETVRKLNPVYFDWIDHANVHKDVPELGFIAQQVNSVIPNVVSMGNHEGDAMSIAYDRLTSLLTGAVKELADMQGVLESRVAALEARQ